MGTTLADRIDAVLPQTQCTRCGYPDCRRYAEALAAGEADINQCPPGGGAGIVKLAALLGRQPKPLNPANGVEQPLRVALIDESLCIGCTLCIQACPVDAIAGGPKYMHTVIASQCTGCDLCLPPCPVDCIAMVEVPDGQREWTPERAEDARRRYAQRNARLAAEREAHAHKLAENRRAIAPDERKRELIQAAMERAAAQRAAAQNSTTPRKRP
jgi:electron transport complex protein RnfB